MVHTVPHCCHSSDPRARNQTGLRARSRSGDVGWIREEFSFPSASAAARSMGGPFLLQQSLRRAQWWCSTAWRSSGKELMTVSI